MLSCFVKLQGTAWYHYKTALHWTVEHQPTTTVNSNTSQITLWRMKCYTVPLRCVFRGDWRSCCERVWLVVWAPPLQWQGQQWRELSRPRSANYRRTSPDSPWNSGGCTEKRRWKENGSLALVCLWAQQHSKGDWGPLAINTVSVCHELTRTSRSGYKWSKVIDYT